LPIGYKFQQQKEQACANQGAAGARGGREFRGLQTMNAQRDVSYDEHLAGSLKDPAEAAAYIDAVMELDDPAALLLALRQVAKAHGMAEVARKSDLGDKTLFKALSAEGNPTLTTIYKVLHAVGLRLSVVPEHA
jgi:probable addiction module antidote protein